MISNIKYLLIIMKKLIKSVGIFVLMTMRFLKKYIPSVVSSMTIINNKVKFTNKSLHFNLIKHNLMSFFLTNTYLCVMFLV